MMRDRILSSVLEVYVPSADGNEGNQSSQQCHINQLAEDVLEALVMKNDFKFLTHSVGPLLKVEQPPRL